MSTDPNPANPSRSHEAAAISETSIAAPPSPEATPEEKDLYWFRNVYAGDRQKQLTWRAVLTGGVLGAVLSLSNLYTTLKIGWSFGVAITACVMSWALWKGLRAVTGGNLTEMSLLENNCMQSTASSAGYSTGSVVGTACAALLIVNDGKSMDPWVLTGFVFFTACLGVFLAIPMKRQMINHEQLPFPSGIAAAETLRSLYAAGREASKKAFALLWAMGVAALLGLVRKLGEIAAAAREIITEKKEQGKAVWEWIDQKTADAFINFSNAIQTVRIPQPAAVDPVTLKAVVFYELKFDPSLLTIGAGMIVGLRASLAMLLGSAILHFGLGPLLIEHQAIVPKPGDDGQLVAALYRWGVWGGTALMVMSSLTSLGFQWKSVARAFSRKNGQGGSEAAAMSAIEVPGQWMIIGLVPIVAGLVWLLDQGLGIPWYLGILGVLMAFPLALVACRATGETDTTPIGAMGKVTQLAFAIMHPGNKVTNLAAAGTTSAAAASAADLLTDLKSGYQLGANPRRQFIAQLAGVFFGTAIIVPAWFLLSHDYAGFQKKFAMPAANAWKAMADLLNPADGKSALSSLPWGAGTAIVIGAVLGILFPVLEKLFPKHRNWIPSAMGLGLGFVIDFATGAGFTTGALIAWLWKKRNAAHAENYTIPIASGFVAGLALMEAIIIIAIAAVTIKL